jgi:glycosyltransferase involved in cell wall biosynthesis
MYDDLFALVQREGLGEHVNFVDYVASDRLPLWYNSADLFAYPSAYEGFGLPVLEAMACGVPVITSASSALVELAGDAAITVPPGSQEALELALMRVLGDEALRAQMRAKGLIRASAFSWDRTASNTIAVYERALAEGVS